MWGGTSSFSGQGQDLIQTQPDALSHAHTPKNSEFNYWKFLFCESQNVHKYGSYTVLF